MSFGFNAQEGLIVVRARLWGSGGDTVARLALDTGATRTVIGGALCVLIGCPPSPNSETVRMTTGSGVEYAPSVTLDRLECLAHVRSPFDIIVHTLPPTASVDGLLGLDFLRNMELAIDFREGRVTLT